MVAPRIYRRHVTVCVHTYTCTYMYVHVQEADIVTFVKSLTRVQLISQANIYSKEGVCLGAVTEQESWVWTCKPRPGPNSNQVVTTATM